MLHRYNNGISRKTRFFFENPKMNYLGGLPTTLGNFGKRRMTFRPEPGVPQYVYT